MIQFDGTERDVENVGRCGVCGSDYTANLLIEGTVLPDGSIERAVRFLGWAEEHPEDDTLHAVLDSGGARRLGQALLDAADELDELRAD